MAIKMWDFEDEPDYGTKITYQGNSLMGKSVLLIGGPKHGETFAIQEKLDTIVLSIQDDVDWSFDDIYKPIPIKTVYYSASGFYLDGMVVYRYQDLITAELKFQLVQYQMENNFGSLGKPIAFFNLTEDEKWEIEKNHKFSFNIISPQPKPKFIPGENCLFT